MTYRHFRPIPQLASHIDSFWIIKSAGTSGVTPRSRMPADSRATLLLSFAGETRLIAENGSVHRLSTGADLIGAHSESFVLEHDGDTDLIAAQFRPGGLASFVRCAMSELSERTTSLDLLWGISGNRLRKQVDDADTTREKLILFQNALAVHLEVTPYQPRVQQAMRHIDSANQELSMDWLAEQVNVSQKQLERSFERVVGMTPKRYSRLARFQRMVSFLRRHDKFADWTSLAVQFGYYDHAHMIKDFHAFAGAPPGKFAAATAGIVEVVYGDQTKLQEV